ncbi:MAG: hypothetical protein KDE47_30405, partial [Caldilineaceae bacterium]|nr:hypothetical protein [Caldilineaceae bacterium]
CSTPNRGLRSASPGRWRHGRRRLPYALLFLVLWPVRPALAQTPSRCPGDYLSPQARIGINVTREGGKEITDYAVSQLNAGWYLDYTWHDAPAHPPTSAPPGTIDYLPMVRPTRFVAAQRAGRLPEALEKALATPLANNPGATWILGNEPDNPAQDRQTPADYAHFYHDAYHLIKTLDSTEQIAIAPITQVTPLRLRYLDAVLDAYRQRYGIPLPVDVWTVHVYMLPEVDSGAVDSQAVDSEQGTNDPGPTTTETAWGIGSPVGLPAVAGEAVRYTQEQHDDVTLFAAQVITFRRWLAARGYRNTPLYLTEYGILLSPYHGFDADRVRTFFLASTAYLQQARDAATGYPADENQLVQRWAWFSLNYYAYGEPISGLNGNLYNHDSRQIQPLGQDFAAYAEKRVLSTIDLQVTALDAVPQANPGLPMTLQGTFINRGGIAATNVAMRFWDGNPTDGGQLLGTAPAKPQVLPDCYHQYTSEFTWSPTASGSYTIYADLTADNLARDQELSNNQQQLTVLVNEGIAVTATPQPTPVPTATATPLPDQTDITVGPTTGGTLRRTDQNGNRVTVQILGDSVTESTTFRLQTSEEETDSASQAARQFASQEFTVVAERAGTIIEDFVLQNPAILTIEYDDKDVVYSSHVGVTEQNATTVEDDMTLYVYNSATRTWQSDGITLLDRDVDANQLRVITEALGRFGLYGSTPPDVNILFLPLLMK